MRLNPGALERADNVLVRVTVDSLSEKKKEKHGENHYRISARMLIDDVNDLFGLDIDNENVDTMGGWLLDQKYDVKEGEEVEYHGYRFKAIQKEKNSIIVIDIFTTKKMKNQVESADSEETEETEVTE